MATTVLALSAGCDGLAPRPGLAPPPGVRLRPRLAAEFDACALPEDRDAAAAAVAPERLRLDSRVLDARAPPPAPRRVPPRLLVALPIRAGDLVARAGLRFAAYGGDGHGNEARLDAP